MTTATHTELMQIAKEAADKYTDSELKECLRLLKLKANF